MNHNTQEYTSLTNKATKYFHQSIKERYGDRAKGSIRTVFHPSVKLIGEVFPSSMQLKDIPVEPLETWDDVIEEYDKYLKQVDRDNKINTILK